MWQNLNKNIFAEYYIYLETYKVMEEKKLTNYHERRKVMYKGINHNTSKYIFVPCVYVGGGSFISSLLWAGYLNVKKKKRRKLDLCMIE